MASAVSLTLMAAAMGVVPDFGPDFNASSLPNMNGDYVLSSTPGADMSKFPKAFKDYPGGAESFEVYSPPITTLYSQVWWAPLAPVSFPPHIIKKYAGKGMAFIGWEIDQVRKGAGPNGEDVSVPISASYNHHYNVRIIGASARFKKVNLTGPDDPRAQEFLAHSGHGMIQWEQPHYSVEQTKPSASGHPISAFATSANGGEYRKSFHGYPPGYALVVDSPTSVQTSPMQIDTWNRDEMDISRNGDVKFVPGPLPAASQAPAVNPEYSGLLECPMTTRLVKNIAGVYQVQSQGECAEPILTFQECFHAAALVLGGDGRHSFVNSTVSNPRLPAGCSVVADPTDPLRVHIFFNKLANTAAKSANCSSGVEVVSGTLAWGVTGEEVDVEVTVSLNATSRLAEITLVGNSSVWFGVAFGARAMGDQPWTIVAEGDGDVSERKLGNHEAGKILDPSVKVVSNVVENGVRTVVVSRGLTGVTADYFSFSVASDDTTIPILVAVGSGPKFSYHKAKAPTSITLLPVRAVGAACVCPQAPKPFGRASGTLVYHATNQSVDVGTSSVGFGAGKCKHFPSTTLIGQRNPTCDIRHYRGGQWACHHMWSLLDAEQDIPWPDQPLVFHHKYRFWVQPFTEGYHKSVQYGRGSSLLIGSPWEYDVPKCGDGVPGCSFVNGTWVHTVTGSKYNDAEMVTLNFHCHAPTCLSMQVYACPTGMSLEDCNSAKSAEEAVAKGYKLLCRQDPVYGGSGNPHVTGSRFDEAGYIAIPDCLWGSPDQGLEPPLNLTGVPLFILKTANASRGHYGEMAGGQPFVLV